MFAARGASFEEPAGARAGSAGAALDTDIQRAARIQTADFFEIRNSPQRIHPSTGSLRSDSIFSIFNFPVNAKSVRWITFDSPATLTH